MPCGAVIIKREVCALGNSTWANGRPLLGPQASSPANVALRSSSMATLAGEDASGPGRARPLVQPYY